MKLSYQVWASIALFTGSLLFLNNVSRDYKENIITGLVDEVALTTDLGEIQNVPFLKEKSKDYLQFDLKRIENGHQSTLYEDDLKSVVYWRLATTQKLSNEEVEILKVLINSHMDKANSYSRPFMSNHVLSYFNSDVFAQRMKKINNSLLLLLKDYDKNFEVLSFLKKEGTTTADLHRDFFSVMYRKDKAQREQIWKEKLQSEFGEPTDFFVK